MIPEKGKAQDEAIEALIGASLRARGKEPGVTDEEISRYVEQRVTLSSEDKSALDKSRPSVLQNIKGILRGENQENQDGPVRPAKAERGTAVASKNHPTAPGEFVEAVAIAQLTKLLAKPEYPLGRFRQTKMLYFSHRKAAEDVSQRFLKKAAGPYNPWAKYQGPERIAVQNGYVKRAKAGAMEGFVIGDKIDAIGRYLSHYPVCGAIDWVVGKFRYRKNEDMELLSTVDFAALDLIQSRTPVTMDNVKHIIANTAEWKEKLNRAIFSDENIARALAELRTLFPATYT